MLGSQQSDAIEQPKRVMLIIFGALIAGALFFAVLAVIHNISQGGPLVSTKFGLMAMIGAAFAVLVLGPSVVVPIFTRKACVKEIAEQNQGKLDQPDSAIKAMIGLQTSMIIGLALLEGATFLNLMGYLIDSSVWNLLIAIGLLVVMFLRIPLPGRVDDWVSDMLQDARLEKG